jgi:hypothetical protein
MAEAEAVKQGARAEPFPSWAALQQAHLALRESLAAPTKNGATGDKQADAAERIRAFIARAKSTGTVLADTIERKSAQGILDYWGIELASLAGAKGHDFVPPLLAPFERTAVGPSVSTESRASQKSGDDKARELIRLAAAARLWRDSGKQHGYLLLDNAAIGQAERFLDKDTNISDLVEASRAATRLRLFLRIAAAAIVVLMAALAGLFLYLIQEEKRHDTEYANLLSKHANSQLEQASTAVGELQKRIDTLEQILRANKIAVPGDTQATETVRNDIAQTIRRDQGVAGGQQAFRDGFIWIGSATEGANNLEDPATGAKVPPGNVVPGTRYRVNKNLVLRAGAPSRSDYSPTDSLGVVPEGTIITALAMPEQPYQRPNGDQYWLKVRVDRTEAPIVYMQFFGGSQESAKQIGANLQQRGYQIPGVEETQLAKGANEVRYYYEQDQKAAEKLANDVTTLGQERGMAPTKAQSFVAKRGPRNFPGVIELWLDLTGKTP